MEHIDAAVKPDHIATLKKHFDKAELKRFCHDIYEECLINILKYHNIKREKIQGTRETLWA